MLTPRGETSSLLQQARDATRTVCTHPNVIGAAVLGLAPIASVEIAMVDASLDVDEPGPSIEPNSDSDPATARLSPAGIGMLSVTNNIATGGLAATDEPYCAVRTHRNVLAAAVHLCPCAPVRVAAIDASLR